MTPKEILELMRKKNKYGSERTNGFDSKLEDSVYKILRFREKAKEIHSLRCKHSVIFTDANIHWCADFSFYEAKTDELLFCEAKGARTARYVIIEQLWRVYGPAPLQIWIGHWTSPFLSETIIPKQKIEGK